MSGNGIQLLMSGVSGEHVQPHAMAEYDIVTSMEHLKLESKILKLNNAISSNVKYKINGLNGPTGLSVVSLVVSKEQ